MRECLISYYTALPTGSGPHFNISNHDARRLMDRYGVEKHRSIGMMLLTLLASPCLYYGDEIGMREGVIPPEKKQDPFEGWMADHSSGRDPSRTPMQWNTDAHAGFTSKNADPWLPVNPDYEELCVDIQRQDPSSTLNFYKQLLQFRRHSTALRSGSIQFLDGNEDGVLTYLRESETERLLIAINFTDNIYQLDLSALTERADYVLSSTMDAPEIASLTTITLRQHESILLKIA